MHNYYPWLEAAHIIAVIAWMAGMLYLPRLFVYHVEAKKGGELDKTLQVMERKLLRYIMNPAMIATLVLGVSLLHVHGMEPWLHAKLTLVFLMVVAHGFLARYRRLFAEGKNQKTQRFFRVLNEAPTVLMILIVILVVVKPF